MNLHAFDDDVTSDLGAEKQSTLRQLSDMFRGTALAKIRVICEESLWNVEVCIDKLITCDDDDVTVKQPSQLNPNAESFTMVGIRKKGGAVPKNIPTTLQPKPNNKSGQDLPQLYEHVYENIKKGYKTLILLRGPPGSGKSYLARMIIQKLLPGRDEKDFKISADDYFYDSLGRYKYNKEQLSDAHAYCQARVREKASLGWSPIIVDNTNTQLWEMIPYIQTAVQNGYIIELMEPQTPWRHSAGKLAAKNSHGVMKGSIQRMLDNFEHCRNKDVLKLLKDTKYEVSLPQMRIYPPPPSASPPPPPEQINTLTLTESTSNAYTMDADVNQEVEQNMQIEKQTTISPDTFVQTTNSWFTSESLPPATGEILRPRSPRQNRRNKQQKQELELEPEPQQTTEHVLCNVNEPFTNFWGIPLYDDKKYTDDSVLPKPFPSVPSVWNDYDKEASTFWGVPITTTSSQSTNVEPMSTDQNEECGLLQLLKEGVQSINVPRKEAQDLSQIQSSDLKRHRVGCEKENSSFILFRQIYPNRSISDLWDLFVKCNGDVDWAVDILLKDIDADSMYSSEGIQSTDTFECDCSNPSLDPPPIGNAPIVDMCVKPQRQRPQKNRAPKAEAMQVKEAIERSFVLGDEHYSSHIKKIRAKRNATDDVPNRKPYSDAQVQTEDDDNENNDSEESGDGSEILEINLGEQLVGQLMDIFKSENPTLTMPEKYKTNVFMPKSIARELYVLWMESMDHQLEEQRQVALKDDEDFARLLKNPKYEECKESPENVKELLDMEYAWMIYKTEKELCRPLVETPPTDLASHLTRMKLCEIFPNIPRETLLDILAAHDNKFSETVEVLKSSVPTTLDPQISTKVLIEKARNENDKLNKEAERQEQVQTNKSNAAQIHSKGGQDDPITSNSRSRSISPDEAKRLALKEFEESRNYAAHHCQLRAECYQKAKEAIQRGNSGVAVYYSQIANLHKKKVDIYNHRAANCIMEVHDRTQNNPDFIDLHYLHVVEAIACLDIFIDKHIAKLRSIFRSYKYVFIITGRGLHSTGGVSTIKTRVKSRLKERNLKWSEVNPGLLKVKIFSASMYAKNL